MASQSALVETLTAEVRVLMVGNRQVTLSVYRQLDLVGPAVKRLRVAMEQTNPKEPHNDDQ